MKLRFKSIKRRRSDYFAPTTYVHIRLQPVASKQRGLVAGRKQMAKKRGAAGARPNKQTRVARENAILSILTTGFCQCQWATRSTISNGCGLNLNRLCQCQVYCQCYLSLLFYYLSEFGRQPGEMKRFHRSNARDEIKWKGQRKTREEFGEWITVYKFYFVANVRTHVLCENSPIEERQKKVFFFFFFYIFCATDCSHKNRTCDCLINLLI